MLGLVNIKDCLNWPDKTLFLDKFNFYQKHELSEFIAPANEIIDAVCMKDLRSDYIVKSLLNIRELPNRLLRQLKAEEQSTFGLDSFTVLYRSSHEVVYGLAGEFWKPNFGLYNITNAEQFQKIQDSRIVKLVLRYKVLEQFSGRRLLRTETYVYCPSKYTKSFFTGYWLIIRPFSGWIRRRMLNSVYRQVHGD